ncbi:hypothetical protein DIT71_15440 [Marinobacter vulgaris]|uniref:Prepilin-type cleavage/methylation domain-containing protein n=1 Tax=Marinobacter vulgaris TaxID=1928331 RepID=A0A2V3ZKE7_9GAMM|nr:type II secretion system protein [Marinobacter vulgaris]PXX89393.1 hypothetical protein DIT71_15440 [Marinobacter vulgaris]TSJ68207.1 type II secretion system protein [Marinobacter vulgaris]
MQRQQGFTLVELVMVIVLLGIVATISTQFVSLSVRGAIDLGDRQQRALQGIVISEQITREIREAFPLSVRENGKCLEWLPILGATTYGALPTGSNDSSVEVAPFGQKIRAGARVIVYGYGSAPSDLYESGRGSNLPNPGPVSPEIEEIDDVDATTITFSGGQTHRFRERSPQKRIYAVDGRVSICQSINSERLYRYSNYNHGTDQPTSAELEADLNLTREVMSANLDDRSLVEWQVTPPLLRRSAVVNFAFVLKALNSAETTRVSQEVQIRNVP